MVPRKMAALVSRNKFRRIVSFIFIYLENRMTLKKNRFLFFLFREKFSIKLNKERKRPDIMKVSRSETVLFSIMLEINNNIKKKNQVSE